MWHCKQHCVILNDDRPGGFRVGTLPFEPALLVPSRVAALRDIVPR